MAFKDVEGALTQYIADQVRESALQDSFDEAGLGPTEQLLHGQIPLEARRHAYLCIYYFMLWWEHVCPQTKLMWYLLLQIKQRIIVDSGSDVLKSLLKIPQLPGTYLWAKCVICEASRGLLKMTR